MTNLNPIQVVFIGGGNMGRAMIGGLIKNGVDPQLITAVDPQPETIKKLATDLSVKTFGSIAETEQELNHAQVIVLAVKPQDFQTAAKQLSSVLKKRASSQPVILSIAAGIQTSDMSKWLEYQTCVRAMPNTPALINQGITGLFAPTYVNSNQRQLAQAICSAVGKVVWINDESLMDSVTALSGSGPAYVFAFLEALQASGEQMGLPTEVARELASQTLMGAAALALQSSESPTTLRQKVTSKGGTTAAALEVLEKKDWSGILQEALTAARKRGAEMAKELGNS